MSEPKIYKLITIKDIFEKIPTDKIEICMQELSKSIISAKHLKELTVEVGKATLNKDISEALIWPDEIEWNDDDKGEITVGIKYLNGNRLISIQHNMK